LIDFGFAETINYTKLENRSGTPGYLPPEMFKNIPYNEKGDVFSAGVIFYCLIFGSTPFKGKTCREVLEKNQKCQISFDSNIWEKLSDECKHLLKKMLEANP
jgi:serine/threonine protein kinase